MATDPLDQRPCIGREEGDLKKRPEDPRCGQGNVENTGGKGQRDCVVEEAGLFAPSASEGFYSEEKRQDEAPRHTSDEMPRHAGATSAGVGTRCGNHRRSEFLWVQAGTLYC